MASINKSTWSTSGGSLAGLDILGCSPKVYPPSNLLRHIIVENATMSPHSPLPRNSSWTLLSQSSNILISRSPTLPSSCRKYHLAPGMPQTNLSYVDDDGGVSKPISTIVSNHLLFIFGRNQPSCLFCCFFSPYFCIWCYMLFKYV